MGKVAHLLRYSLFIALTALTSYSYGASSVMIWPIDPVQEDKDKSVIVWLENRHSEPVYLQVRVLAWRQDNNQDRYSEQNDISVSPPFALIQPGKRQLIRLMKTGPVTDGAEKAYRILVDEIPHAQDKSNRANQAGGRFNMRYSIPLFSSGENIWTKQDYRNPRDLTQATAPKLSFRVVRSQGKKWLEIKNDGAVHARIARLSRVMGKKSVVVADGLVGYVLAHSTMRLQVPNGVQINNGSRIEAMINHSKSPTIIQPA